jgi:hypothetical protein
MKGLATDHHLEKAHGEQAPGDEEGNGEEHLPSEAWAAMAVGDLAVVLRGG